MSIINKFGSHIYLKKKYSNNEMIDKNGVMEIVEKTLRKHMYMRRSGDGFDSNESRIINLANPVDGTDSTNKRFVEAVVEREIKRFRRSIFDKDGNINVKQRRMHNVGFPLLDQDAVNKAYVDNLVRLTFSTVLLQIRPEIKDNCYIFEGYDSYHYQIPFDSSIKINRHNINKDFIEVLINNNTINAQIWDGNYSDVKKDDFLCFRKKEGQPKLKHRAYVEFLFRTLV